MASIIEQVAQAESQAGAIRREATQNARDILQEANEAAVNIALDAREAMKFVVQKAQESAAQEGEMLRAKLHREAVEKVRVECEGARTHLDDAVAYIYNEVIK